MAVRALHAELVLAPKPGLVCPNDNGSHRDMTAATLYASLFSLRHYFQQIADEGGKRGSFAAMQALGIAAEARMMQATRGVNVHRGAIFALGLLVASAARVARRHGRISPGAVSGTLGALWGDEIRANRRGTTSHGDVVAARYGSGGAREQAACGYPAVFELALPVLRSALEGGLGRRRALLQTLFVLIAELDDTNLLYRGGKDGLAFAQCAAHRFLAAGGTRAPGWEAEATAIRDAFVARNLSPGGSADLLAATWFVHCASDAQ